MKESPRPDSPEHELPEEVVDRIRRHSGASVPVPPAVDEAILTNARRHLAAVRASRPAAVVPRRVFRKTVLTVVTASLMIVAAVWQFRLRPPEDPAARVANAGRPTDPDDVNRDGRVDILDAFTLARRVERGEPFSADQDRDRDGRVSRADVDELAGRVVML